MRRKNLAGYVTLVLSLNDLAEASLESLTKRSPDTPAAKVAVQVRDAGPQQERLYQSAGWLEDIPESPRLESDFELKVKGQKWQLLCRPTAALTAAATPP